MEKRLTEKRNNKIGYGYKEYSSEGSIEITKKLGQLEDIEEELGINLLVLLQALKDGISYTTKSGKKDYY